MSRFYLRSDDTMPMMAGTSKSSRGRDLIATALMLLAALGAVASFVFSVGPALGADSSIRVVEVWRAYAYLVFAGLFVLLAFWPRRYPGVWELVILHKVALTVSAVTVLSDATDATTVLIGDGVVSVFLISAYVLARGYAGWTTLSRSS